MAKELTQAEMIDDFKQFVGASISASEKNVTEKLTRELGGRIDRLRSEMHDGFAGIADIFENHQSQLDEHNRDIKLLKFQTK